VNSAEIDCRNFCQSHIATIIIKNKLKLKKKPQWELFVYRVVVGSLVWGRKRGLKDGGCCQKGSAQLYLKQVPFLRLQVTPERPRDTGSGGHGCQPTVMAEPRRHGPQCKPTPRGGRRAVLAGF
jgi:hypothetical protein